MIEHQPSNGKAVSQFFRDAFYFCLGIIVALISAWATHSVTQEQLEREIKAITVEMNRIANNQNEVMRQVGDIRVELESIRVQQQKNILDIEHNKHMRQ